MEENMGRQYPLKIDAYSHIVPEKYREFLEAEFPEQCRRRVNGVPTLYDLDARFRIMDRYEGLIQVLTLGHPPIEEIAHGKKAIELAQRANDALADLVARYPDRFVAAIAVLPLDNVEATVAEIERAINDLKMRGILLNTPFEGKPLDLPEFMPIYERMVYYDLPVLIHPTRLANKPDYEGESASKHRVFSLFGWPYETTVAMTRFVFGGIFRKYPQLKVVTHHCGGMVPYLEERIKQFYDSDETLRGGKDKQGLTKAPIEYFKSFYNDTAIYGNTSALMCAYTFFGADRLLFGADMPLGCTELGNRNYRQTINAIEQMAISDEDKKKIFEDNVRRLMRLPI